MDLGLRDKVVLVSGASRGIGRAIALRFASAGSCVALVARDEAELNQATTAVAEAAGDPSRAMAIAADMSDDRHINRAVREVQAKWGRIDVAVANVGSGAGSPLFEATLEEWTSSLKINLLAGVELARAVLPLMRQQRSGVFLFISSIVGDEAMPAPLAYVAAKSALNAVAKNLSRATAADGVRVNVLAPGNVSFEGGAWARRLQQDAAHVHAYIDREVPMQRFGTPEEVADAALFLCSDRAAFITGARLVVDGGQTRRF